MSNQEYVESIIELINKSNNGQLLELVYRLAKKLLV